jgi:hypothetical protein
MVGNGSKNGVGRRIVHHDDSSAAQLAGVYLIVPRKRQTSVGRRHCSQISLENRSPARSAP